MSFKNKYNDIAMEHLLKHWDKIKKVIGKKSIMLFLDYDGTLSPIVEEPDKALMSDGIRSLLKELSSSNKFKLAIVSGRALSNVKKLVGLDNIVYVGNHGLEIDGPKLKFRSPVSPKTASIIKNIYSELYNKLSKIKGIIIEDKNFTLSVHYRLVNKDKVELVNKIIEEVIRPYLKERSVKVNSGKKVIEIKPPIEWNKGKVVLWLLGREDFVTEEKPVMPIYIGDDVTDEDAFLALKNRGITIFVGKPRLSEAKYYLKDIREVESFLREILSYN